MSLKHLVPETKKVLRKKKKIDRYGHLKDTEDSLKRFALVKSGTN